jgi:hypothetical protein
LRERLVRGDLELAERLQERQLRLARIEHRRVGAEQPAAVHVERRGDRGELAQPRSSREK